MWLPPVSKCNKALAFLPDKGKRFIVLQDGTRDSGLTDGCELVLETKSSSGDYHQEMNDEVFFEWIDISYYPGLDTPSCRPDG